MKQHSAAFERLVAEVKPRITEISIEQVSEKQKKGDKFFFVDVREDHEWAAGKAAGAMHIGRGVLERDIEKLIPDLDSEIVLYCGGGYRSALAAENLQKMGYRHVLSMQGGYRGWLEKGLKVETT
jgi:rhodanese-related sulfurtransferase